MWKKWSNWLFWGFIVLMLIPTTRKPIQTFLIRTVGMWAPMKEGGQKLNREEHSLKVVMSNGEWRNPAEGNKPVFINFWATWCPPCIAEMPSVQGLYEEMKDEVDFYILTNDEREKVATFMQSKGYTFPVGYPSGPLPADLDHGSIPFTLVLGADGSVLFRSSGARNWNSNKVKNAIRNSIQNSR